MPKNTVDIILTPKNEMPRIDFLWAFLSVDKDGNEGVIAAPLFGPGSIVPLVAAEQRRLDFMTPIARGIAAATGQAIRLVKFSNREVIEEFGGS